MPSMAIAAACSSVGSRGSGQDLIVEAAGCRAAAGCGSGKRLVVLARGALDAQQLEVPVKELVHRRAGALLVHLGEEPAPRLLGSLGCARAGRNDLGEVVPFLRHGVDAGVDVHA